MIVVDSSALIAILFREPQSNALIDRLGASTESQRFLSAANYLETGAVIAGRVPDAMAGLKDLDTLIVLFGIKVVPLTEAQARIGLQGRILFGRGSGSPARLNLGDCYAYALARDLDAPLLFIGDDFTHTDVRSALPVTSR